MDAQLLTRDEFRAAVFARDNNRCVICSAQGQDAHHIMERRLFDNGGYYLNNGATLCGECHVAAEKTLISVEDIRVAAGVTGKVLPDHLEADTVWDKWGNPILANGQRLRGELFADASVQKVLGAGGVLSLFTKRVKYPRTPHLPWSPGAADDDTVLHSLTHFVDQHVVVTVKLDGENTTFYNDFMHARSPEGDHHPSQTWARRIHAMIAHEIPEGYRICMENVYAKHAIHYKNLDSYLYMLSMWDKNNYCLSWEETCEWSALLDIPTPPVLYCGAWNEGLVRSLYSKHYNDDELEGYVVRLTDAFPYSKFRYSVAKFVRSGHVRDTQNWRNRPVVKNLLRNAIVAQQ